MKRISALITSAVRLAERVGTSLEWLSPALARLTVGLVFFQSGWGKLHDLDKVTNYFTELGLAAPAFQAIAKFDLQYLEVPPDAPRTALSATG